jgi:hypothetical protein
MMVSSYRSLSKILPERLKVSLARFILALPKGHRFLRRRIRTYVISYPKSGRTWLRTLLGKVLQEHFELDLEDPSLLLEIDKLCQLDGRIPCIRLTHDDRPHFKRPEDLSTDKTRYRRSKVIFLVRDPRDIVVSNYFEYIKRGAKYNAADPEYQEDLSSYLHYEIGSLETLIRFYNIWGQNRHVPLGFLLVSYEDLHRNTAKELRRVLDFLGLDEVRDEVVDQAVEFGRFDNMHRLETQGVIQSFRLRPGDANDPESYKTRRGKVGGYVDYLDSDDIDCLNRRMDTELDSYYGYNSGANPRAK